MNDVTDFPEDTNGGVLPILDDDEEVRRFESWCLQIAIFYTVSYLAIGIGTTVAGIFFQNGWIPFLGWTWPIWGTIIAFSLAKSRWVGR